MGQGANVRFNRTNRTHPSMANNSASTGQPANRPIMGAPLPRSSLEMQGVRNQQGFIEVALCAPMMVVRYNQQSGRLEPVNNRFLTGGRYEQQRREIKTLQGKDE